MMRAGFLPFALFTLSAATLPQSLGSDPHIQTVGYSADQVVSLQGALGWQIQVEFGSDERIENVSIGDATAWQVTPNKRANMLFLKPLVKGATTNMTVVTSTRKYTFALSTGARLASTPWVLRFDYPLPAMVVRDAPVAPATPPPQLNFSYVRTGDPLVMPTRVWDDGRQTYFEFAENIAMPAIFAADGRKEESLVNVSTRGRIQVVQQVGSRFLLRSGTHLATVTRAR